jgi:hypothetical protein
MSFELSDALWDAWHADGDAPINESIDWNSRSRIRATCRCMN